MAHDTVSSTSSRSDSGMTVDSLRSVSCTDRLENSLSETEAGTEDGTTLTQTTRDVQLEDEHLESRHYDHDPNGERQREGDVDLPEINPSPTTGSTNGEYGGTSTLASFKLAQHRRRETIFHLKAWWQEIACCLLAIVLLIGLVVVLRTFENKPGPRWPNDISLNTVVAILATMCRALTVLPVSEGLSQLKWNTFAQTQRPLGDIYAFDQASRGPFSSLMLLPRTKGRLLSVSTLAALILVSGLATSSLTQATISLAQPPEAQVAEAVAKRSIDPFRNRQATPERVESMQEGAYSTLLMRQQGRRDLLYQQIAPSCPVGDCRWEPFDSVGICAATKNLTDKLEIHELDFEMAESYPTHDGAEYYNVTLHREEFKPFGILDANWETSGPILGMEHPFPQPTEFYGFLEDTSEDPPAEDTVAILARQHFIFKPSPELEKDRSSIDIKLTEDGKLPSYRGSRSPYRATQVAWYWCIHTYEANVAAGVPHTTLTREAFNLRHVHEGGDVPSVTLTNAEKTEEFTFSAMSLDLGGLLNETDHLGSALQKKGFGDPDSKADISQIFSELVDDMALAMTIPLRLLEEETGSTILGYARVGDMIVIVRWPWISLLASQIVLTIVFLGYVIADTAKTGVEVVKSSNFAELMAIVKRGDGLDDRLGHGIRAEMDDDYIGKLERAEGGWDLNIHRAAVTNTEKETPWYQKWAGFESKSGIGKGKTSKKDATPED